MLGWFIEDFREFAKECRKTSKKAEELSNDNSLSPNEKKIVDLMVEIAKQNSIIADISNSNVGDDDDE